MKLVQNQGFIIFIPSIIIGIATLLGGTVALAQVSLPDSPLYGIKTASERVRLAVAFSDDIKAKTHLSIAREKVKEIEKLAQREIVAKPLEKAEANYVLHRERARGYVEKKNEGQDTDQMSDSLDIIDSRHEAAMEELLPKLPQAAQERIKDNLDKAEQGGANNPSERPGSNKPEGRGR
jgi:hypothetical protein